MRALHDITVDLKGDNGKKSKATEMKPFAKGLNSNTIDTKLKNHNKACKSKAIEHLTTFKKAIDEYLS